MTTTIPTKPTAGRAVFARVLVGIDGSQQALEAARRAALVAWSGKEVNERLIHAITIHHDDTVDAPADALTRASDDADLAVIGSRGLHGLRALGSVSEQVAHQAHRSALVIREPTWQCVAEELGG